VQVACLQQPGAPVQTAPGGPLGSDADRGLDRPVAEGNQHRAALPRAGYQATRVTEPETRWNRRDHQRDAVEQRGDDRAPPVERRVPYDREAIELHAGLGRGARTQRAACR